MGVVWPAALLGLIALAIPLLIHLLARGEPTRIAVATTRFVRERPKLRWRRLQISHPLLLALRMALVVLCVLLIAEPFRHLPTNTNRDNAWTLVSTRLDATQAQAFIADGNTAPRWLAAGFPLLEQPRPVWQAGQLWSLLDAANQLAPGVIPFDVIVPTNIGPPGALRPTLARAINWIDAGTIATPAIAAATLNIDIVYDPEQQHEMNAIATAISAWQDVGLRVAARYIPATTTLRAPFVVWLSSHPLPTSDKKTRIVVAQRALIDSATVTTGFAASGSVSVREQHAHGMDVRILETLFEPGGSPHSNLARNLLTAFLGSQISSPPQDYPVAIDQLRSASRNGAQQNTPILQSLTALFVWLIVLTAVLERIVSATVMRTTRDA